MNIPILLKDIASIQADIEHHQRMAETAKRNQQEKLDKLGGILRAGIDADNFPLRLQLNKTHEIRVCGETLFDQFSHLAKAMNVCKTENLDQATLMKLLEEIEE